MWGNSFNNAEAASQIRSRADASAGLVSLTIGFVLQAGGYIAGATIDTGVVRALCAVAVMIVARCRSLARLGRRSCSETSSGASTAFALSTAIPMMQVSCRHAIQPWFSPKTGRCA
jgi:hypothetical protein